MISAFRGWWEWEGWRTYSERSVGGGDVVQGDNEEFELGSGLLIKFKRIS